MSASMDVGDTNSLPVLTAPQMTALSNLYHTDGSLLMHGPASRPAKRLVELGLAEPSGLLWHRVTPKGADVFLRLTARLDTPQGAAARRRLAGRA